jgi:hypothetical protein
MFRLKLASCMAENTEEFCQVLAVYLQSQLVVPTECVTDVPWQERERLFDQGEIQLLWLYGLPYVNKADLEQSRTELLVVPVPAGWHARLSASCSRECAYLIPSVSLCSRGGRLTSAHCKRGKVMKSLEGQKAPAFTLAGNDGNNHSLDEFKGKTVVVFFYPKDSTPG